MHDPYSSFSSRHRIRDLPLEQEKLSVGAKVHEVSEQITSKLTVYVLGDENARWQADPQERISSITALRLRELLYLVLMLKAEEDPITIQSWFTGLNPMLGDRCPARLLRENWDKNFPSVLDAAHIFVQNG